MAILNLTPHAVNVDGTVFLPSGNVARVSSISVDAGVFEGVPLARTSFGNVIDLPDQQDGTLLIVSGMVRSALPNRLDLASPGDLIRNESGQVTGCKNLIVN